MASCARLRLAHAHSDSSLLSQEEADRVRADLNEQAHRANLLKRETLVETSAGKVMEKRLTATVMRRRHTEPAPLRPLSEEPFHFEVEQEAGEPFVASFVDQRPIAEPAIATLIEPSGRDRGDSGRHITRDNRSSRGASARSTSAASHRGERPCRARAFRSRIGGGGAVASNPSCTTRIASRSRRATDGPGRLPARVTHDQFDQQRTRRRALAR